MLNFENASAAADEDINVIRQQIVFFCEMQ